MRILFAAAGRLIRMLFVTGGRLIRMLFAVGGRLIRMLFAVGGRLIRVLFAVGGRLMPMLIAAGRRLMPMLIAAGERLILVLIVAGERLMPMLSAASRHPTLRAVAQALFSLALLTWLFTRIDIDQLWEALLATDLTLWAAGLATAAAAWLLNTAKWRVLLQALGYPSPYLKLLGLNFIGMFYSVVLPGQVSGEVVKGFRLARQGVPTGPTTMTITLDRLTGLVALGLLGLAGLLLAPPPFPSGPFLALSALVVLAAASPIVLLVLRPSPHPAQPPPSDLNLLQRFLYQAQEAIATYRRSPQVLALALVQALGFQALVVVSNYLIALGVGVQVSPIALLWIVSVVSLVSMLPLTLGGLGLREGAYAFLLQQYGVPLSLGISLSLGVFGVILTLSVMGGVVEALWPRLAGDATNATPTPLESTEPQHR